MSGRLAPPRAVTLVVNGLAHDVEPGVSVAAALLGLGAHAFRRSTSGESRAPVCGMGTCFECRVMIDGSAHRRSCLVVVADGMRVETADAETRA